MYEVVITVEGGQVAAVYASTENFISLEIIDADTDDAAQEMEIRRELRKLERRIAAGELYQVG